MDSVSFITFGEHPTVDGVYIATEMASKAFTDMTLKLIHE